MPASLARRTMSLTHKLFGIRSCNEAITGDRPRPCLEFDIKRCVAPCVRALCSEDEYRLAVGHTKLFLEGRNDELLITLRERMADAATAERYEQAAQIRDAIRTIETLRTRQQKMASPELGDRDAFGLKLGPAGAVVQIFQMRGGKVVERIELVTESRDRLEPVGTDKSEGAPDLTECDVLQAALQQFYAERIAAPEVHIPVPVPAADAEVLEGWLSGEAGASCAVVVPKARRETRSTGSCGAQCPGQPTRRASTRTSRHFHAALRTCCAVMLGGRSAANRVLRHLHDSGKRNRRLDGRLRGRPHETIGVPEVQNPRECNHFPTRSE